MSTNLNGAVSLEWVLDSSGTWDLQDGETVWARLSPMEGAWAASAGDHAWTLQRVGFRHPRIVVRPMGEMAEVAHVLHDWQGRTLCIESGPVYDLERSSTGLVVRASDGTSVVRLEWIAGYDAAAARVHLDSPEATGPLGLLILVVAGSMFIDDLFDPSLPRTVGETSGPTVRERFE
ncbi:MAG: hypothetical protein Q8P41_02055 [Pseudomonadota bacterium]|nr:hypothetical protein [Pseudomonadota bacterium]